MAEQTILIAEDDPDIRDGVRILLSGEGYHIIEAENGTRALEVFRPEVDLVILDIMMPGMSGLRVCEELRKLSTVPILFLTAKSQESDKLLGLTAGGDDYLPKPFEPDELICRVRAMLRRGGTYQPTVLAFGDVTLDPGSGVLSCCGQSVRLSGREFQVMELFLRSPQVVLSADRIMERVWGWDSEAEINVVWVHISNLRKKLRSIGSHVTIRASRGLGYLLEVEV